MKITNFVFRETDLLNVIALVDIVIDNNLCIKKLRLVSGNKGLFLGFPSVKISNGYSDVVFPINTTVRNELTLTIFEEFKKNFPEKAKDFYIHTQNNFATLR